MLLRFDPTASRVEAETRAVGMLAKLAHDLSIAARDVTATVLLEGGEARVDLEVRVASLEVRGVRKGTIVDEGALSSSDKAEIQRKIREEVLRAPSVRATVRCDAASVSEGDGRRDVDARGTLTVGTASAPVRARVNLAVDGAKVGAKGRAKVNLRALGITPPKGPLGAFKVHEDVEIVFDLVFVKDEAAGPGQG